MCEQAVYNTLLSLQTYLAVAGAEGPKIGGMQTHASLLWTPYQDQLPGLKAAVQA